MKRLVALTIVILIFTSTVSFANDLDSLGAAIRDNRDITHLFSGSRNTLMGLSRSVFDVIRYALLAGAIIRLFMLFMEYSNVTDNPQIISSIKTKSMWYVLGILFVLNFWSIIEFANKIFVKIKLL